MTNGVHPCAGLIAFSVKLISGARPRWFNCEPVARQRIYFANHSSHLDLVVLWAALPPEIRAATRPVAARDYWTKAAFRRYVATTVFRAVLVERPESNVNSALAGRAVLDPLLEAVDNGYSLILFPEGTRGDGCEMRRFRAGLYYLLHLRPGLEGIPVYLENLNRVLPKGAVLPAPVISRVTFGPPLRPNDGEDKEAFLGRARDAVLNLRNI
jgi:1-acyl-sn-glycerol-3-phosphate acyltransferase